MKDSPNIKISTKKFDQILRTTTWFSVATMVTTCVVIQKLGNFIVVKSGNKILAVVVGVIIYLLVAKFINRYIKASVKLHNNELIKECEELATALEGTKLTNSDQLRELLEILTKEK